MPSSLGEAYHSLQFSSLATLPLCKSQEIYDFVDDSSLFFFNYESGEGVLSCGFIHPKWKWNLQIFLKIAILFPNLCLPSVIHLFMI